MENIVIFKSASYHDAGVRKIAEDDTKSISSVFVLIYNRSI
jgi:hypothetical protein